MNVIMLDRNLEIPNEVSSVEGLFNTINQTFLDRPDLTLSHMVMDGQEIYESYKEYILEHLTDIEEVIIYSSTLREFAEGVLLSTEQYIRSALPELTLIVDQLYKGEESEVWNKFDQFLEGLQWMLNMLNLFSQENLGFKHAKGYKGYYDKIKDHIILLQQAQKDHDLVLIADLINFEIKPLFEGLHEQVNQTIDNEVVRNDLS